MGKHLKPPAAVAAQVRKEKDMLQWRKVPKQRNVGSFWAGDDAQGQPAFSIFRRPKILFSGRKVWEFMLLDLGSGERSTHATLKAAKLAAEKQLVPPGDFTADGTWILRDGEPYVGLLMLGGGARTREVRQLAHDMAAWLNGRQKATREFMPAVVPAVYRDGAE